MKLTAVLILAFTLQLNAKSYSQKISISEKNIPLSRVIRLIEKQTGYSFIYENKALRRAKPISFDIKNTDLTEALNMCFKDQPLVYEIKYNTVIIREKEIADKIATEKKDNPAIPPPITVKGSITNEKGLPLAGATITIKGTGRSVVSDNNGNYSITVASTKVVLVFSYVGFVTEEKVVGNAVTINIKLAEDLKDISEVVVIGYGTQRKRDVTGAISTVKASELDVSASSNFLQSLQGKATGIQVTQSTGQPGAGVSIKIRSNPSNANPGTLYVIDGVVINNDAGTPGAAKYGSTGVDQSPLNFINPNDIESIEILKDASSRAIYGAQAGAGVVLISTKRGKSGKPTIQYTGSYATQQVDKMYQVLDTKEYMKQMNLVAEEMYLQKNMVAPYYGTVDAGSIPAYTPVFTQQQIDTTPGYPNAMDAITQPGYTQQHNLSVSSSNGKTTYFISANYFDQKGVILGTNYKRWNGRASLDQNISDKLKVGINLIGSNSTSNNTVTGGQFENGGIITAAMYYPANMPLQLSDGTYPLNPKYSNIPNPLSFATVTDILKNQRLLTSAYGQLEIIKGLTAKANFSFDQGNTNRNSYFPTTFSYGAQVNGIASISNNFFSTTQMDYTLNYKWQVKESQSLDVLAGYTYQLQKSEGENAGNQNFTSDILSYYNLGAGQSDKPGVGSYKSQVTYASYFARAIYQFHNKYTLQASVRRDGSSRFAENHKWGYFPAVSAGWIASEESFLQNSKVINFLKLRASYGEIGNANFPASAFEVFGLRVDPNFGTGTSSTGIFLTQAANPDLKWETAAEINVGLDFAILNNRISGSVDYFNKSIRDLITYIPFPADFTVGGVYGNAGTTKSTGYEIGIQSRNMVSANGGFNWSTNINFSHYLSYWAKRSPQAIATMAKYISVSGTTAVFNGIYGFEGTGQLLTGEYGKSPDVMPNLLPGSIILKDIHGYGTDGTLTGPDGKITDADQTLLANADPKFNIGFGNRFTYKNFDLNIFFSGVVQKGWSPYAPNGIYRIASLVNNMGTYAWNTMPISLQRWTFQNPDAGFPTGLSDPTYASYQNNSSYWLVDASYLRCQNITLGYNIPQSLIRKQHTITGLRISVDLQNAFVITNYPQLDPQLAQNNFYPLSKSIVFGINATF